MNRIVYCLKGESPVYNLGLLRNLTMLPLFYPADLWAPLVITNFDSIPHQTCTELERLKVECIDIRETPLRGTPCHFWRFWSLRLPAVFENPDAFVLFRDADSRVSEREVQCVSAWMTHDMAFHTIKDHPLHTGTAMGGLFGIRVRKARAIGFIDALFPALNSWLQAIPASARKWDDKGEVSDQTFMDERLWPSFWTHLWVDDFRAQSITEPATGRVHPPFNGPFIGERVLLDAQGRDTPEAEARRLRAESFK